MSKCRIKFSKLGMGKYISHLDLLRAFSRTITRANLPVKFTQGFNPHPIIAFALPLSVGVTSETEFVDIEFEDSVSFEEIKDGLNSCLPPDLKVTSVSEPTFKVKDIVAAEYEVVICGDFRENAKNTAEFFNQPVVMIVKKSKRGEREVNLMEFVEDWEVTGETDDKIVLRLSLSAGGEKNIKPELVTHALEDYFKPIEFESVSIHRTGIITLQIC